ncbi:uncharacterized protein EI97DRAFT_437075 [Westerdykella ornata]|uniref:Secreted protein n=1 Tax=Westerdykella ornata TaxID=318751 RepID=A0A6A6J7E8_WESOR|nr:uncharacterized protein EI97DRAFT_437075 [Westerdykella ornata]KAF2272315.1 hypothetical protein EI97DRAFT_437075 [Westerdykella ornata]
MISFVPAGSVQGALCGLLLACLHWIAPATYNGPGGAHGYYGPFLISRTMPHRSECKAGGCNLGGCTIRQSGMGNAASPQSRALRIAQVSLQGRNPYL